MDALAQEKTCPNCGGDGYVPTQDRTGIGARPCEICDAAGTLPPHAPLYQEALDARAQRLNLKHQATAKRGDLERHDAQARKLANITADRTAEVVQILFREGPLSPDLKLAALDLQTAVNVLVEVVS